MNVLLTRPAEQSKETAAKLHDLGHRVVVEPLLKILPTNAPLPEHPHDCIILTSSNAVSALDRQWPSAGRDKVPVLVTGSSTKKAVQSAGFQNTTSVDGSASDIVKFAPSWLQSMRATKNPQILYPCAKTIAVNIPQELALLDLRCTAWPVYEAIEPTLLSPKVVRALQDRTIDITLLYSSRTAAAFTRLLFVHKIPLETVATATLSPQITNALPEKMQSLSKIAANPNEDSLFDLLSP